MRYLLDTHVFIWWMEENRRLPSKIKSIIDDPLNHISISIITPWEMVIKIKAKKLNVPKNFTETIMGGVFNILPIEMTHVLENKKLPLLHKDPFDRMLIAQGIAEDLTLITSDKKIWKYQVPLLKA